MWFRDCSCWGANVRYALEFCFSVLIGMLTSLTPLVSVQDQKKNDEVKKDQHLRQTVREGKLARREDFDDCMSLLRDE